MQMFRVSKVDYAIENNVTGYVTDTFTDMPLRAALPRLLSRASAPLEFHVYEGAIIVKAKKP